MIQSSVVGRQSSDSVVGRWPLVVGQLLLVLAVCFWSVAGSAQQKTLALKGGKLLTISHGTIENGVLVISAGKISCHRRSQFSEGPERRASDRCDWDDGVSRTDRL